MPFLCHCISVSQNSLLNHFGPIAALSDFRSVKAWMEEVNL